MVDCTRCGATGLDWYRDQFDRSKLGIKLDVNTYREHKCPPKNTASVPQKTPMKPTHRWCYECDISIRLDAPCEHMGGL